MGVWSLKGQFRLQRPSPKGWELSSPQERLGQKPLECWARVCRKTGGCGMLHPETPPVASPLASPRQVNHLRCLHEFVESQTTYYAQCYRHMLDLQKQLGRCPLGSPGSQAQ